MQGGVEPPCIALEEHLMKNNIHAALVTALIAGAASTARAAAPELAYGVTEGKNLNAFVREGRVAAHLVLRSGTDPRIIVAFPAANSGVGLWFASVTVPVTWRLLQPALPVTVEDAKHRPLYGVRAVASLKIPQLTIRGAVLSSVRVLRDYEVLRTFPAAVAVAPTLQGKTIDYRRDRIDGAPGYRLTLTVLDGTLAGDTITAGADGRIELAIEAASGEKPLTPLSGDQLLNASAAPDPAARNALTFLSYREKFLAGSWRFETYFGRDTLMSLRLLMPALQPQAIEAGLSSVLARLAPDGEAAHEEGLGEFAVLEHRRLHDGLGDKPTLDHGMIDTSFMLGPVMAHYLLDTQGGRARARAYLAAPVVGNLGQNPRETAAAALARNLAFVIAAARPFAADPRATNLVAIKPGRATGQWRDSDTGLGGGRYAYDVNAALVPAALDAAARMDAAGLLAAAAPVDRAIFAGAARMARTWRDKAAPLFAVTVAPGRARAAIAAYAQRVGVSPTPALTALGAAPITFHALSLDANDAPIPILNSDEGFALLFTTPTPADLETNINTVMRPFPAGLMTDVGLLVANPLFAKPPIQKTFTSNAYHGTVIWSWQQALMAAGLERQLTRTDLPSPVRAHLIAAQSTLWRAIEATRAYRSSELWSWAFTDGRYRVVPFGAAAKDVDESNAAQLWSTVYLAVRPPRAAR